MEKHILWVRMDNSRRKFRPGAWLKLAAVVMLIAAIAQTTVQPTAIAQCSGSSVTLKNQNSFPIWLGETVVPGQAILTPPGTPPTGRSTRAVQFPCVYRRIGPREFFGRAPNVTLPARSGRTQVTWHATIRQIALQTMFAMAECA